jgi:hypothetical protein
MSKILTEKGLWNMYYNSSVEVLMKIFFNMTFVFLITICILSSVSCGSSSSSTTTGFIVDPADLSTPAAVHTSNANLTAYSVSFSSSTTRYAIIYQSTTQTGVSIGYYTSKGHELAKLSFYANEGSSTKAIPTTAGDSTSFSSSDGVVTVKYAADSTNSAQKALNMNKTTGTVSFTITYNSAGTYDISAISIPDSNVTIGTIDNAVKP